MIALKVVKAESSLMSSDGHHNNTRKLFWYVPANDVFSALDMRTGSEVAPW